jgi:hypothetical protein
VKSVELFPLDLNYCRIDFFVILIIHLFQNINLNIKNINYILIFFNNKSNYNKNIFIKKFKRLER